MNSIKLLLLAVGLTIFSCKPSQYADLGDGVYANIKTNKGDMVLKLTYDKTPVTVANFISLAEGTNPFVEDKFKDKKYYDGLTFHRIAKDFVIQGGCPDATGMGNPGYKFKDEFHDSLSHNKKGMLSMANGGAKTNGSQFFITLKNIDFLDKRHSVFGEIVKGMEVVDSISKVAVDNRDKPTDDVIMNTVSIIRNGKEAKKFDAVKVMTEYFEEEKKVEQAFNDMLSNLAAEFETQKKEAKELPSGLKIYTFKKGDGEQPKIGQKVKVFYAGYLESGKLFDSNIEAVATQHNKLNPQRKAMGGYDAFPMDFSPDASLIAGFKEGLLNMKVGDKVRIFIPGHLGYGAQGEPRAGIAPNADLVFDLEITAIAK